MIIGLDVGGTHTDAVLLGKDGLINSVKVTTDADNLFESLISALESLTEGCDTKSIERMVLSTTLATNLVVQKKLPSVGVIVSAGPGIDPACFSIGDYYHVVQGALDHSGREIASLNEKEIQTIGKRLKADSIQSCAVVSKFSVRNPIHEERIASLLKPYVENIYLGHQLSGSLNFPRRIMTTYLNGAVSEIHTNFFRAVQESLDEHNLSVPLLVLKPDGGSMNIESSLEYPAQTILSGPSASVMGALGAASDNKVSLVCDIGGTTTDMAIILRGAPVIAQNGIEIGGCKTLIRALETKSIAIGGDSVVRIRGGAITIGPDRNGVAMAYGGKDLTPTDALAFMGLLKDGDSGASGKGVTDLSLNLETEPEDCAEQIITSCCDEILETANQMVEQLNSRPVYTVHEMFEEPIEGIDEILVLGGPAKPFAHCLQKQFKGEVKVVPNCQVANAVGCALSRVTCEVAVYADTGRNLLTTQGSETEIQLSQRADIHDVRNIALDLVKEKAVSRGADEENLETEIIEESQFNMIRGFNSQGKNIRVRAQVKPGIVSGYSLKKEND